MVGTPWLLTTFWYRESLWEIVQCLEAKFCWDMTLIFRKDFLAELILKVLADHENNLAETSLDSVINTVVHDGLTVRT